jgi:hypothetical protein
MADMLDKPTAGDKQPIKLGERPKHNRWRTLLGLTITLAYLAGAAFYTNCGASLVPLPPNQLADFLAGVFAPLAFLWLVLGFFQQGEDLRVNGQALWLQGEELRNSVEQQRLLVEVQREANQVEQRRLDAEAQRLQKEREEVERLAKPDLMIVNGGYSTTGRAVTMTHALLNRGADCLDLRVTVENVAIKQPRFARGASLPLRFRVPAEYGLDAGIQTYVAKFVDSLGNEGEQELHLAVDQNSDGLIIMEPLK